MSTQITCNKSNQLKLPSCKVLMEATIQANDHGHGLQETQQQQQDFPPTNKHPCGPFTSELSRLSPLVKRRYVKSPASPTFLQSSAPQKMPLRGSVVRYHESSTSPYHLHAPDNQKQNGGGYFPYGNSPQAREQHLPFYENGPEGQSPFRRGAGDYPQVSASKFVLPSPTVSMSRRDSQTDAFEGFTSTANGTTVYGKSFGLDGGDISNFPMTPMTEMSEEMTTVVDEYCSNPQRRNTVAAIDGYLDEQIGSGNGGTYGDRSPVYGPSHGQAGYQQNQHHQQPAPPPPPPQQQQLHHRYYSGGSSSLRSHGDTPLTKLERRRKAHLDSEKRRRGNIKNGMDELMSLIPGCSTASGELAQQDGKANSKAIVLRKAKDYIVQLLKKIEEVEREKERIENEYQRANTEREHFQMENERLLALQKDSGHRDFRCNL